MGTRAAVNGASGGMPRLDTLLLALQVSWRGLIAQYTGRQYRDYPGNAEVRIYDYNGFRISGSKLGLYNRFTYGNLCKRFGSMDEYQSLANQPGVPLIFRLTRSDNLRIFH